MNQDNNDFFYNVLNTLCEPIWCIDREYKLTYFNQLFSNQFLQVWGKVPQKGKRLKDQIAENSGLDWSQWYDRALSGEEFSFEHPMGPAHFKTSFTPLKNEKGEIYGASVLSTDITELKRVSEDLLKSQNKFKAILNAVPDLIFVVSSEGVFLDYHTSEVSTTPLVASPEEFIGQPIEKIMPESIAHQSLEYIEYVFQFGGIKSFEYQLELNETIWYFEARFIKSGNDEALIVVRNINDWKRTQIALLDSEKRYKNLYNKTPIMMHSIDKEGNLVSVSDYWLENLGYSKEEVIGHKSTEFLTESSREFAINNILPDFFKTGLCKDVPYQFVKKDGELVEILLSAIAEKDGTGDFIRTLAVLVDITQRKHMEQELLNNETLLRQIIEAIPAGIVYVGNDGSIINANLQAQTVLGLSFDELTKKFVNDFEVTTIWENGSPCKAEDYPVSICLMTGEPAGPATIGVKKPDGQISWAVFTAIPFTLDSGKNNGAIVTFLDITERKEWEERIRHTQKLESMGLLAGGIAHDFNNLLVGVLGNAELASMSISEGSDHTKYIQRIENSAQRAADLTHQLLAYSGKGKFIVNTFNLSELIKNMSNLLEVSISKKAQVIFLFHDKPVWIKADPGQIQQVYMNLLINASEALEGQAGEIIVRTSICKVDQNCKDFVSNGQLTEGHYATLSIEDNGVGISEDTILKIFDPFYTTRFTGRGLGLSVVQGIVHSHQGLIKVNSQPEEGTTFSVFFPLSSKEQSPQSNYGINKSGISKQGEGLILVVDDEEDVLFVVKTALEKAGYQVILANNGYDGLELYKSKSQLINAIVLDLTMPDIGGDEILEIISRDNPYIPVLLSSGYSQQEIQSSIKNHRYISFIQKPFQPTSLVKELGRLLEESQGV